MKASTAGGTLEYAVSDFVYGASFARSGAAFLSTVSCVAYGVSVLSCGATAMTPSMAALLAEMVVRIPRPLVPPPAALTAAAASAGGMVAGFLYVASLVKSAECAWSTASSGANFTALPSCTESFVARATTEACVCANLMMPASRVAIAAIDAGGGGSENAALYVAASAWTVAP